MALTKEQIESIRKLVAEGKGNKEIAEIIGTTKYAVEYYLKKLGIVRQQDYRKVMYTEEQARWLRLNYPHVTNWFIMMFFGITEKVLRNWIRELNLKKADDFTTECQERNVHKMHLANQTRIRKRKTQTA